MTEQMLDIGVVRTDGDTQPRVAIDQEVVAEYAELIKSGTEMPSIEVVHDGARYWLVDGFHRLFAHRVAGRPQIRACVDTGMQTDAQWLSLAANKTHGLRRTNADKGKAVLRALRLRPGLSDVAIAEHAGVSHSTVAKYRKTLESTCRIGKLNHRTGRDGRTRNTAKSCKHQNLRHQRNGKVPQAFTPVRMGVPPQPMMALNMPHDPEMGARTLIELFSAEYLRVLSSFLVRHLEGVAA